MPNSAARSVWPVRPLLDKRISFGCINVPVKFYDHVVSPAFTGTNGIVDVLPETRPAREVFGSYKAKKQADWQTENLADPLPAVSRSAR